MDYDLTLHPELSPPEEEQAFNIALPWTAEARLRDAAGQMERSTRLDIYRHRLQSMLEAHKALHLAAVDKARLQADTIRHNSSCEQTRLRAEAADREEALLLGAFLKKLEYYETMRDRLPVEILDALRERALEQFTQRANSLPKEAGK
jgi:hypothetical protein